LEVPYRKKVRPRPDFSVARQAELIGKLSPRLGRRLRLF
jgi:hypothetical protein